VDDAYNHEFFNWLDRGAVGSARVIVPLVLDLLPVESVVDVGCGRGAWLSVFREHGVDRILGIDGDHVERDRLLIPSADFLAHDLTTPLSSQEQFDLVVSLEVAEHLPEKFAPQFVRTLAGLGSVILFSAAIPSQGGTDHVNEQWPDYWARLFSAVGFRPLDCIRPLVWEDPNVEVWYAQNVLVFANDEAIGVSPNLQILAEDRPGPLSIVHPRLFLTPRSRYSAREMALIVKGSVLVPAKVKMQTALRRLRERFGCGRPR
jgi:SAM-dependent methyltransferase